MNIEQLLLNKLKAEQQTFALHALSKPDRRDAFEYGHRVGYVVGLEKALNILLTLLDEEKHDSKEL